MARKPRRVGSQLLSSPPVGAPEWTVKQNWKGKIKIHVFLIYFFIHFFFIQMHPAQLLEDNYLEI